MNISRIPSVFDPTQFITVAQDLEANLRATVGRLYYGYFLLAREKSRILTEINVHWEVIRVTTARNRSLGDNLSKLSRIRKVADYELLPQRQSDQDWAVNWQKAQEISKNLLPGLQRLVQY